MRHNLVILALVMTSACTGGAAPTAGGNEEAGNAIATSNVAARTPAEVVEHHVGAMKTGDVSAIMSDYADNTVVIAPAGLVPDQNPPTGPGVYSGKNEATRVFTTLTNKDNIEAVKSMVTTIEPRGNDVAFLHWMQLAGTPQQVSGQDIFVVRDNKIVFQDIIPDTK